MTEVKPDPAPYWQEDLAIGEGPFYRDTYPIRLKVHSSQERISWTDELVPLSQEQKRDRRRRYFHGRPYILLPDYTATIAIYRQPQPSGAVGQVISSAWEGLRHQEVGQAQAWYYPLDRTLVLWECYLYDRFIYKPPAEDTTLQSLWSRFEQVLLERCRAAARIYTTWEDVYEREEWQEFLRRQGYQPAGAATFAKEVTGS